MQAALTSVATFLISAVIGLAGLHLLWRTGPIVKKTLLAPAFGFALVVVPTLLFSRVGFPVSTFALPLVAALLLSAGIVLVVTKPAMPWTRLIPFATFLGIGFLLVGRPMFAYGSDWMSYSNDDMANYVLGSERFVNHGYFEVPSAQSVLTNSDATANYYFFHAVEGERTGVDLILADVAVLSKRPTIEAFMPVIMAGLVAVVAASVSVLIDTNGEALAAAIACPLISLSALTAFGALYQLLGQVFGMTALLACVACLPDATRAYSWRGISSVLGILLASLTIFYPELLPFLFLIAVLYGGILACRRTLAFRRIGSVAATTFAALLVATNAHLPTMLVLLMLRIKGQSASVDYSKTLFPFYLMPSGLANLWGIQPISTFLDDPLQSLLIVLSGLLLIAAVVYAMRLAIEARIEGCLLVVFAGIVAIMFVRRSDFGLYKLAMYCQPALWAVVAVFLARQVESALKTRSRSQVLRRLAIPTALTLLIVALNFETQRYYVDASADMTSRTGGAFAEVRHVSSDRVVSQLRSTLSSLPPGGILSNTNNVSLAKFESAFAIGHPLYFNSGDFMANIAYVDESARPPIWTADFDRRQRAARLMIEARNRGFSVLEFDFCRCGHRLNDHFVLDERPFDPPVSGAGAKYFLESTGRQTILNRSSDSVWGDVRVTPLNEVHDRLAFVNSVLGIAPGASGGDFAKSRYSLFGLEPDYFEPTRTMSAIGRYLLFEVVNPAQKLRLVLDFSASLTSDGRNEIPAAIIIGEHRVPLLRNKSRGSARLFSPVVLPQRIRARAFVGLDMGSYGSLFPDRRTGLMRAYGMYVRPDSRRINGFARNISVISDADYHSLKAPSELSKFPRDLYNDALEYSGLYEDGWASEDVRAGLSGGGKLRYLVVKGGIPRISSIAVAPVVTIMADGRKIFERVVSFGQLDIQVPTNLSAGTHDIEVLFDQAQHLPSPDNRIVGAKLDRLGFVDANNVSLTWSRGNESSN